MILHMYICIICVLDMHVVHRGSLQPPVAKFPSPLRCQKVGADNVDAVHPLLVSWLSYPR